MDRQQRKVLDHLLDSYERSRTFRGDNQVSQTFSVSVVKIFPKYNDDAEYDYFCQINESMEELCAEGLVTLAYWKKGVLKKITLNSKRLDVCYEMLGRMPRRREQEDLVRIWDDLCHGDELCRQKESGQEHQIPLVKYMSAQRLRVEKNLNVEYYNHDLEEYRELLLAVKAVLENQEEIFIRSFSMQLFHDSKRMEQLKHKIEALLYQYGEYQERDFVLEECGIVHTPTYVMMKGNGSIRIGRKRRSGENESIDREVSFDGEAGTDMEMEPERKIGSEEQEIDLSLIEGDIALSTESIKSLKTVTVMGNRVVTVENLTSFHDYPAEDDFVVYLGGFHNKVKRDFLLFLYQRNREKEYRHFGDIDAGGFYILEHLKKETGIPFRSLYMDTKTLERYRGDRKPLTENDRRRLLQLKEELEERIQHEETEDYRDVISYMLDENCKLEQEAVQYGKGMFT